MKLQQIIEQLRHLAGDGPPPGKRRFCRLTGLNNWAWEQFGLKWSDIVAQAGFQPQLFGKNAFQRDDVILRYIGLARELGRLPVKRELHGKRKQDPAFPSAQAIENRLGRRRQQIEAVLEYCERQGASKIAGIALPHYAQNQSTKGAPFAGATAGGMAATRDDFEDVAALCREALAKEAGKHDGRSEPTVAHPAGSPGVYLLQCGSRHKIGKSNDVDQRINQLKRQLPQKARLLHVIRTDDPDGVERYWHARFQDKLIKNEWFRLDAADVLAFRRCLMM